ncbi:MAG: hypothetical protein LW721_16800 [Flammeovirgaceae bacterium]|jgi:hypothetical protein|nr:hypothetical protein [Flammeovirgaceae bacterium]
MKHSLVIACLFSIAITLNGQNYFPLTSSGGYTGGSGDHTNITNAQLKLQSTAGYIRVAHLSAVPSISAVYNFEANKNVYWGEDTDGGQYLFRGRDVNIGRNLWVNNGATISSEFADNDPNYSWNYNLMVRNNNNSINTFSRLSFVSQSGGYGAISLLKTGDYTGDMYFQVRNGAGFFSTPLLIKSDGKIGIGTASPSKTLEVSGDASANSLYLRNAWNSTRITGNGEYLEYRSSWYHTFYGLTNSNPAMFIDGRAGNVGIGTINPGSFKLAVEGKIWAKEVQVALTNPGPDYVFEPTYDLKPLAEIETYIKENKHLPEVPSAKEMEKNGVQLGEMNMLLLKKVEELTLHLIELKKQNEELKNRVEKIENKK